MSCPCVRMQGSLSESDSSSTAQVAAVTTEARKGKRVDGAETSNQKTEGARRSHAG